MQHLQKTRGTSFKPRAFLFLFPGALFNSSRCLRACRSASHLPYTLPSSVSCISFVCSSYENTGGVGVFLPFRHSSLAAVPNSFSKTPAVGEGRHFLISQTPSQCLGASAAFPLSLEPQLAPRVGCLSLRQ